MHISITFEFDLDLTVIDRQVYSILDWLGDVGGLGEALFFICGGVLMITQFGQFDLMLIKSLYLVKKRNKPLDEADLNDNMDDDANTDNRRSKHKNLARRQSIIEQSEPVQDVSAIRLCIRSRCNCIMKMICLGRPNRAERILKQAKQRLAEETDIVEMIKTIRESRMLIQCLVGPSLH